jgi:uncharacterized integral membrane protein
MKKDIIITILLLKIGKGGSHMQFSFILSLIFAILVAAFALLNSSTTIINLIFTKVETSQALVILFSAALGALIVYLLNIFRQIKSSMKIKELEKENKRLGDAVAKITKELNGLKIEKNNEETVGMSNESK